MKPRQIRRTLFSIIVTLVLAVLAIPSLSLSAYAEGEVIQAASFLDFANTTSADVGNATYLVDKDTGIVNDEEPFEEVFGQEYPEDDVAACVTIEESGEYLVSNEDEDTLYVTSTFGCKRLLVSATLTSLYGAEKGVTFEGETILQFATEEATEAAYNELVALYGVDNVMPDFLVWAMDAHGWGTAAMGMDVQTSKLTSYINDGTVSGDKVVVAVTDSGINPNHEVFSNCTISSASTVIGSAGSSYLDDDGHGTMTAGVIAESCPANIEIMAIKVLNSQGSGSNIDCLNGIRYAVRNGADVINCSWGGKGSETSNSFRSHIRNTETYCKEAYDNNILICASAGNDGQDMDEDTYTYTTSDNQTVTLRQPCWMPSECKYVMCIGSVDNVDITGAGQRSYFSNYGNNLEFTAPGRSVSLAEYETNTEYGTHSGTSFSSPYVAAACALLKEYDRSIGFEDAIQALASISRDFGDEGWDREFGYGMPVFGDDEPLGHVWDTDSVSWEWTADDAGGYSAATATLHCKYDPAHTNVAEATIESERDGDQVTYTATASFDGVAYVFADTKIAADATSPAETPSDSLYLAFGSDRHTVTTAIGTAMAGIPKGIVSYVGLAGDLASDTTDKTSDVLNELIAALGDQLNATNVDDIYGNHDEQMARDTDPDIINVDSSGSSGLVYTGVDDDGNVQYYVWGIAYDDMAAKHNEQGINDDYNAEVSAARAQAFKEWVDGIDPSIPIIVISHVPLHAKRGDNYSGAVWNEALNYAATGRQNVSATDTDCDIIRNVVFLHGHNHTSESALRNYLPYNADDANTSDSRAVAFQSGSSSTVTTPIYYSYMTAGYMSTRSGNVGAYNNNAAHATLMELSDDQLKFYLFPAANLASAQVRQTVNRVQTPEDGQLLSINVDASAVKTTYTIGEALDLSGLVVTANYFNAGTRVVNDYTTDAETAVDLTVTGTYTVTVSYTEGGVTKQASFEITVESAPLETSGVAFVRTNTLEAGEEYLIVNSGETGAGFALTQSSGTVDRDEVTVLPKADLTDDAYITADDVDGGSVWTASAEDGNLKLKNGGRYLQISGTSSGWNTTYSLSAATSQSDSNGVWAYSGNALGYRFASTSTWGGSTSTTRYLRYTNDAFTTSSSNSYPVYLYKKVSIAEPVMYTVKFVDDDGETVLKKATEYAEGTPAAEIVLPETPTKEPTVEYAYEFAGWDPELADVTADATYTATYTATKRTYAITWLDGDGNELRTDQVEYGETPAYDGDVPTKTATDEFSYTFNGAWDPEVAPVTGEATYTAQFDATTNKYAITWLDGDGNVLGTDQVEYGVTPAYDGDVPTKTATDEFSYTFNGAWDPEVAPVTGEATYTAQFDATTNKYAITFVDEDGETVLKGAAQYEYGTAAADIEQPETPTKEATAQYTYEFAGWDPELAEVTKDATYKATYSATTNEYAITWVDGDGRKLKTDTVAYGETPAYDGYDPTKASTVSKDYTFNGTWDPEPEPVTGDATYTAQFDESVRKYTVTFVDEDGETVLKGTAQYEYGTAAADIEQPGTPTKEATAQYTYEFAGWDPELAVVTKDATYKATYAATTNEYAITWLDGDGNELRTDQVEYGETPAYEGDEPTKTATDEFTYSFSGAWDPEVAPVTGAATYTAQFDGSARSYTVRFVDFDGTVLSSADYPYGTPATEIELPADPARPASGGCAFAFEGWVPDVAEVTCSVTYVASYSVSYSDGWVDLPGGGKGYARNGELVTGWLDLNGAKYWFGDGGAMATGWTDVEVGGKLMHYYFNPASGNLARGTWMTIEGKKYYFRESGNMATGWATISDNGVDKKYYLDESGQMLTGWQEIEVNGKAMRYYFRDSGAMATGWATIDGEKYWFRPSGNMATGWADVDDEFKRYFDESGHMVTGWQEIGGRTYYFRPSGAMQTGTATIDGKEYTFSDRGVLVQ